MSIPFGRVRLIAIADLLAQVHAQRVGPGRELQPRPQQSRATVRDGSGRWDVLIVNCHVVRTHCLEIMLIDLAVEVGPQKVYCGMAQPALCLPAKGIRLPTRSGDRHIELVAWMPQLLGSPDRLGNEQVPCIVLRTSRFLKHFASDFDTAAANASARSSVDVEPLAHDVFLDQIW